MSEMMPGAVTTADLYRELVGMREQLTVLVTRGAVAEERYGTLRQDVDQNAAKIAQLERLRWKVTGAAMALAALISTAVTIVAAHIHLAR